MAAALQRRIGMLLRVMQGDNGRRFARLDFVVCIRRLVPAGQKGHGAQQ